MAKKGWYWPWLLTAGMSGIVTVNVAMLVVAGSDANGAVVEPDYYRKAVAWDSTMAERAASAALGWHAEAVIAGAPGEPSDVEVTLTDSTGAAVTGATVQAVLIHNAEAARHLALPLHELGGGRYGAPATLTHPGLWEVRIDAVRGAERFVQSRRTDMVARAGN